MAEVTLFVVLVAVFAVFAVLIAMNRRRGRSWSQPDGDATTVRTEFPDVWYSPELPKASLFTSGKRRSGHLTVLPDHKKLVFESPSAATEFTDVTGVSVGPRGTDFVNNWVEVSAVVDGTPTSGYLMDGRKLGWAAMFGPGTAELADSVARLVHRPS